jgi:translation elongation factor EF-1beta
LTGRCSQRWSCGNTKSIQTGDRIFLLKVGTEPKGIIAAGFATSTPFYERHWSGEKKEISQIVNHTINTGIYISDNSSANIQNSNIIGGSQNNFSEDFKKNVLELTEKIERLAEDIEVDRDDIAFEISKIKLELQKEESPQLIKSAFNAIKGIASNVAANEISDVINQGFQNINF